MVRRSWMVGASIEATLERWASELRDVKARLRPLFQQERMAASAGLFLDGLLGEERRKTGGCAPRRRAIQGRGGNRQCWAKGAWVPSRRGGGGKLPKGAPIGMRTRYVTSSATMWSSIWQPIMPFLSLTRR